MAGLPQAPTPYDPLVHPAAARARQVAVLRSLVRVGAIPASRGRAVLGRPLALRGGSRLAAVRSVSVTPGPALAWVDAAAGVALAALGVLVFHVRRRASGRRLLVLAAGAVGAVLVVLGTAAFLRSLRSL